MNKINTTIQTRLSIREFRELYDKINKREIIYLSSEDSDPVTPKISFVSNRIQISINPNLIILSNNTGSTVVFRMVKYIDIEDKEDLMLFNIVCGNFYDDDHDVVYSVYAS